MIVFEHIRIDDPKQEFDLVAPRGGKTVAYHLLSKQGLEGLLENGITENEIELCVGVAKCHDKDLYNKKIGREISKGRMNWEPFKMEAQVARGLFNGQPIISHIIVFTSSELKIQFQYILAYDGKVYTSVEEI